MVERKKLTMPAIGDIFRIWGHMLSGVVHHLRLLLMKVARGQ